MSPEHRRQALARVLRAVPILVLCLVLAGASRPAAAQSPAPARGKSDVRNARYCELITVVRSGIHFEAAVYNTLGLNDCPAKLWNTLTEAAMKQRFEATEVVLNGPRYFLMDTITGEGATAAGETIDVDGLKLTKRATIRLSITELRSGPYKEKAIERETKYVFKAGKPVFVLEAPGGSRYAMQAYAQIVDKKLSYDDLPKLGPRLKLPKGWRYAVMVPDKDLTLGAQGKAIVVQDDLDDTYQKFN
jgi:hypothetical protein